MTAGKPESSALWKKVAADEMPPKKQQPRVTAEELKLLRAWIAAGAPDK